MTVKLGELGDQLYALNERIAEANAAVKVLDDEKRALENKLLSAMQEAGTDIARGERATVSISEVVRPQIQDFDAFAAFLYRKKALHMVERRIAASAYREMKEQLGGKPVPGLSEFTQIRLNVRKV